MSIRILSNAFIADLKDGLLKPFVNQVKKDNTLMLCIRNGYINIYYRGGNILRIKEKTENIYEIFFDKNYAKGENISLPNSSYLDEYSVQLWVGAIPELKQLMDFHFTKNEKLEREFQQIVVRENNTSKISNETEYFITDVEYSVPLPGGDKTARFDLIGIRWDAKSRQALNKCKPVIIEMKYADSALIGTAGIDSHVEDISDLVGCDSAVTNVIETIEYQYNLLVDLGLVNINQQGHITLDKKSELEVVFLLANTNPRGKKLRDLVIADSQEQQNNMPFDKLNAIENVDLRFFVANYSGYALHSYCMKPLDEFKRLITNDNISR